MIKYENLKNFFIRKRIFYISLAVFICALSALIAVNIKLTQKINEYSELYNQQLEINKQLSEIIANEKNAEAKVDEQPQVVVYGTKEEISAEVRSKMSGITIKDNSPVKYDELDFLSIPYHNFSGEHSVGHMVVNKAISDEVIDIFYKLYELNYPIESLELAEDFDKKQNTLLNSTELASMGNNNTCAFYYKPDGNDFSPHSYGLAIDINPKINPSLDKDGVPVPKTAVKYLNPTELSPAEEAARITEDSEICKIFKAYGWTWGGNTNGEPSCFYKEIN